MILAELDRVSRTRPLTDAESLALERSIRAHERKRSKWHWTQQEDRRIRAFLRNNRRSCYRVSKIKTLAAELGRSYLATLKRIQRLRNCPNAMRDKTS